MPAMLTTIRPFAVRAIGVIGIATAALVIGPLAVASADDNALPGAPIIRTAERGVANAGPSEVRVANIGAPQGGVTPISNGGGLVKDGNESVPKGLPGRVTGGVVCYNVTGPHGHAAWLGDGQGYDSVITC